MDGADERYARYTRPSETDPDIGAFVDAVVKDGQGWLGAQRELATLVVAEKLGRLSGILAIALVSVLCVAGVLAMASIALALWLGRAMDDMALGFLTVAGVHLVFTLLFHVLWRKVLRDRLTLAIINAVHEND
ncbi:MAG: hypothetical protein RBT71_10925 [Flavobacteriales bacterium]|jgi:hypothetical protein|nr:hypothetical protein [Flavobacteriales bacterium]